MPSRHLLGAVAVYYRGSPQYSIVQKLFWGKYFSHSPGSQSCPWERFPPESSLSGSVPSRRLLDAVAVYYRGSPKYSIVQKLFWGKYFLHLPGSQSCLWERFPPESTLSGSVLSRQLVSAVAVYYRGSPKYSIVQKLFWGKYFPHSPGSQSCPWERFPPESTLSGSVPSRHLLGAVAVYYRGSPKYSIVQKLFWGKSFPHSPGCQSCLWERFPPESSLSGSVPSRHLLGDVAVYYRGSPQYSIAQKLFWGKYFPHSPGSQSCLWERFPPESSLSGSVPSRHLLGAVAVYYRGSPRYSIVQKLFWEKSFPHSPGSQSCLWERFPLESSLSGSVPSRHLLGAIAVYHRESPQYSIPQKLFWGKYFPHSPGSQSCLWERFPPECSLSGSVPSRHLLGAVAIYCRGSPRYSIVQKLFWEKSFPHSPGFQSCLWERFPPESSLSGSVPSRHLFGAVPTHHWRSHQYSIVQKG